MHEDKVPGAGVEIVDGNHFGHLGRRHCIGVSGLGQIVAGQDLSIDRADRVRHCRWRQQCDRRGVGRRAGEESPLENPFSASPRARPLDACSSQKSMKMSQFGTFHSEEGVLASRPDPQGSASHSPLGVSPGSVYLTPGGRISSPAKLLVVQHEDVRSTVKAQGGVRKGFKSRFAATVYPTATLEVNAWK